MSIRNRLLLVLLLAAILPLAALRGVQAYSMVKLRERIDTRMRADLTEQAQRELRRVADGYASSLEQDSRLLFALLKVQAAESERLLRLEVPDEPGRVLSPQEFGRLYAESPSQLPELVVSAFHGQVRTDNRFSAEPVSYGQSVTLEIDTGNPDDVAQHREDALKLSQMTGVYRAVWEKAPDLILWQYTSLKNGLHVSYPGKAGYPPGYSPLQRDWFIRTLKADEPIIVPPQIDYSTRQIVTTFARPVRDAEGRAIGVTAIDVPYSSVLDRTQLQTEWSAQAVLMILTPFQPNADPPAEQGDEAVLPPMDDVYIAANLDDEFRVTVPATPMTPAPQRAVTLDFDHPADRAAVLEGLIQERVGVHRVLIGGVDTMIAYGPITAPGDAPAFATILVPAAAIAAPAEAVIAEVNDEIQASLINTGVALALVLVVVMLLALQMSRKMSRPVIELADVANRVAGGDLDAKVTQLDGPREIAEVGRAFNAMVPKLRDQIAVRESLAVAMQVQQALLPAGPPTVPGLDIAGHSEYCDETGGDYYDFIQLDQLDPNTVAIAIGDVTGHGIAAALLMATGRALIRSRAAMIGSLEEVFTGVNENLCDGRFAGRFMTLFYMLLTTANTDAETDAPHLTLRYLSAGHDPTLVYRPGEDRFIEIAGKDIPLGIDADWTFHELTTTDFQIGDVMVAGTDGIWECFNAQGKQFGKDRMMDAIRASAAGSAEAITQTISKAVHEWRGDHEQGDDITMVVVKVTG